MNRFLSIAWLGLAVLTATGCATKNYGRQGELTGVERNTMNCRELELETAKVHGFLARVEKESEFDTRSVLSFLGDFGVGNVMEKSSAVESANARLAQLQQVRTQRGCTTTMALAAENAAAGAAAAPASAPAAATTPATAAPAASAPAARGQWSYQVETMARQGKCNSDPRSSMIAKGPGFETYSVACSNGDVMMLRCEFGNCRVMQ